MELSECLSIPERFEVDVLPTGSSVICEPPVLNTDIDFVICTQFPQELYEFLCTEGYKTSVKDDDEYDLVENDYGIGCYRKGKINLIVVDDDRFFKLWVKATSLAKDFNLTDKNHRVALFQAILYPE